MKNPRKRIYASSNSPQVSIQPQPFFLGFYLESCYNLCHAIRFLSAGSGREGEGRGREGAPSLANSRRRGSVSDMCACAHPREPAALPAGRRSQDSSQAGTEQLAGQQAGLTQPRSVDQKNDKTVEKHPPVEPGSDGSCAHSSGKLAGEGGAGYRVGLKPHPSAVAK